MRRCAILLVPALLASLLGAAPGDKPATPDLTRLIEQLGDPDFKQRERAMEQLRQQGTAALPALRTALEHPDAEVRRRVLELVPPLETAVLITPRRVNLTGTNRTAKQFLDDLAKQTGYGIDCWGGDTEKVFSLDLHDVTFWEALDRVSQEGGLVLQPGYGTDRLRLSAQNSFSPYVLHQGAFRFAAIGLTQVRNLDLTQPARNPAPVRRSNSLAFTFSVSAEPRLPILGVGEPHVDAAYDSERNTLLPPVNEPNEQDPMLGVRGVRFSTSRRFSNRSLTQQVELSLVRPSEKAETIKLIRGTIPLTLLVSQKPVVLTDKPLEARNTKVVIDRMTFVVEDVTQLPTKQFQMRLSATDEGDGSLLNTLYQRLEILDTKGNKMMVYGTSWGSNGNNSVRLTLTFGALGAAMPDPPAKISFLSWTTLVHNVEFEFRDIPLP